MTIPRSVAVILVAASAAISAIAFVALPAAGSEPMATYTVDSVHVNKIGAITVSGTADCTGAYEALLAAGTIDADDVVTIHVNIDNWKAYQPVGRKGMITAEHWSEMLQPCFSNDPEPPYSDRCAPDGAPCSWQTSRYNWEGPWWVMSDDGPFKQGLVHIDLFPADEGWWILNREWQPAPPISGLGASLGVDIRATRVK
jgi:hypothetical protein